MRALGIDFGEKRIGLAVSDADGRYAIPWQTLRRQSDRQAIEELGKLATEQSIDLIVIGDPRNLDGTVGPRAERVSAFAEKLTAALELPLETVNESLTSHEAEERMRAAGLPRHKRRQRIDSLAAQILLQEALDRRRRSRSPGSVG